MSGSYFVIFAHLYVPVFFFSSDPIFVIKTVKCKISSLKVGILRLYNVEQT